MKPDGDEPRQPPPTLDYQRPTTALRSGRAAVIHRASDHLLIITPYQGRFGHWVWFNGITLILAFGVLLWLLDVIYGWVLYRARWPIPDAWLMSILLSFIVGFVVIAWLVARGFGTRTVLMIDHTAIHQLIEGRFSTRRGRSRLWPRNDIARLSMGGADTENQCVVMLHLLNGESHPLVASSYAGEARLMLRHISERLRLPLPAEPVEETPGDSAPSDL